MLNSIIRSPLSVVLFDTGTPSPLTTFVYPGLQNRHVLIIDKCIIDKKRNKYIYVHICMN